MTKYCCFILQYLVKDERVNIGKTIGVWTSRTPEGGDWEPELLELKFCPNCGKSMLPAPQDTNTVTYDGRSIDGIE